MQGELTPGVHASRVFLGPGATPGSQAFYKVQKPGFSFNKVREHALANHKKTHPSLEHPNLVTPLGAKQDTARGEVQVIYPVMTGRLLPSVVQELSVEQGYELYRKILGALIVLHATGNEHGQIHPGQIIVTSEMEPALLDVGYLWGEDTTSDMRQLIAIAAALPLPAKVAVAAAERYDSAEEALTAVEAAYNRVEHIAPAGVAGGFSTPQPAEPAPTTTPEPANEEAEQSTVELATQAESSDSSPEEIGINKVDFSTQTSPATEEQALNPSVNTPTTAGVAGGFSTPQPAEPAPTTTPEPANEEAIEQDPAPATTAPEPKTKTPESHAVTRTEFTPFTPTTFKPAQEPKSAPSTEPQTVAEQETEKVSQPSKRKFTFTRHQKNSTPKTAETKTPQISRRTALASMGVMSTLAAGYILYTANSEQSEETAGKNTNADPQLETVDTVPGYQNTGIYTIPLSESASVLVTEAAIITLEGKTLTFYSTTKGDKIRDIELPGELESIKETKVGEKPAIAWIAGGKIYVHTQETLTSGKDPHTTEAKGKTLLNNDGERLLATGDNHRCLNDKGELEEYKAPAGLTPIAADTTGMICGGIDTPVIISDPNGTTVQTTTLATIEGAPYMYAWLAAGQGHTYTIWAATEQPAANDAVHLLVHSLKDGNVVDSKTMLLGEAEKYKVVTGQGGKLLGFGPYAWSMEDGTVAFELPAGYQVAKVRGLAVIATDAQGANTQLHIKGKQPVIYIHNVLGFVSGSVIVQRGSVITAYPDEIA